MRGTKRPVATLRNRKALDHKKSNRAATVAKGVDDGDYEDVPDSVAAANADVGSKFHNRTLQIFLHEMRAALDQEVVVDQVGKSTGRHSWFGLGLISIIWGHTVGLGLWFPQLVGQSTAVSSEAWAKLRDWASVACRGRLLLSGSVAHASLKTAVPSQKVYH